jgi:nitrogen fixation/metabolism regulation signal transduction histidine kinase
MGFLVAAKISVQNIDQLLHLAYDSEVEEAIKFGMTQAKDAYSLKQELVVQRLNQQRPTPNSEISLDRALKSADALNIMGASSYTIAAIKTKSQPIWSQKDTLQFNDFSVVFNSIATSEDYFRVEKTLQKYKVLGLELERRIRPALTRSLSIALGVVALLLTAVFIAISLRFRSQVVGVIGGFEKYAIGQNSFRFKARGANEFGIIEQYFNRMADELDYTRSRTLGLERLASWQTVARKMAHEIKNPLTPIQIMIAQLKKNYSGHDEKFQTLLNSSYQVITEEVLALRRMVDNFSEFARLPKANLKPGDIVSTLQGAVSFIGSSYAPHQINLHCNASQITVVHDDQLIRHLILNLVKNAAEAAPGSALPIDIFVEPKLTDIVIRVMDYGPGIPPELRDHIFEAYVTSKHTGPSPGMGLGLAICQKVVLEHGGKIKIESSPGSTNVTITLPLKQRTML